MKIHFFFNTKNNKIVYSGNVSNVFKNLNLMFVYKYELYGNNILWYN